MLGDLLEKAKAMFGALNPANLIYANRSKKSRPKGVGRCADCHRKHKPSAHRFHGYRFSFVVK